MTEVRAFLLLRYTLIASTAYLLLVEKGFVLPAAGTIALIALALASNLVIGRLPTRIVDSPTGIMSVIVFDTVWITTALVYSGRFSAEFFYLYFFVLLLAAIGENLRLIAIASVVLCGAYLYGHAASGGTWSLWRSPSLIRIPFLFTTAIFYGYLVDRTRRERRRADENELLSRELTRVADELRHLYTKAQDADRIKAKFFASVSHEVRTPLSVLLGYIDLLLDLSFGAMTLEQEEVLERARLAGRSLQDLIVRMLDVSRIESARESPAREEFDLTLLFDELSTDLSGNDRVEVQWPAFCDTPLLLSDPAKVRTVIRNLVDNAIKFTPDGEVRIEARWDGETDQIVVQVSDTGVGIQPEELGRIFEAFRSAGDPNRPSAAGVGLGLYIARRLANLLGGRIEVASSPGVGSTFSVHIPRQLPPPTLQSEPTMLHVEAA